MGCRIVIAFDGGRLRERIDKKGRKKLNGYRDFDAPWVEPRQLVIYAIDEDGKPCKTFGKLAYASLAGPDEPAAETVWEVLEAGERGADAAAQELLRDGSSRRAR